MIFQNNFIYFQHKKMIFFGGGSGDTVSVDYAYNKRMATIAEEQSDMAGEYFDFWKSGTGGSYQTKTVANPNKGWGQPKTIQERTWAPDGSTNGFRDMEQAQINANIEQIPFQSELDLENIQAQRDILPGQTALGMAQNEANLSLIPSQTSYAGEQIAAGRELLPGQTALSGEQTAASRELLPLQTGYSKAQITDSMTAMNERAPVRNAFYKESLEGVDVESRANRAAADASQSFMNSNNIMRRNSARMGVNPNSGRFAGMQNENSLNRAKTVAGAKTKARTGAEQENYGRLNTAMGGNI